MFTKARIAVGLVLGLGLAAGGIAAADTAQQPQHQGRRAEMIQKFDTNKDGKLDDSEKAAMKAQFKAKRDAMKAQNLAKYDANKNGKLDDAERQTMQADRKAERFKKIDKNGDGKITPDEFNAAPAGHHGRMGHGHHRGGGRPAK